MSIPNPARNLIRIIILIIQMSITFAVLLIFHVIFSLEDTDDFSFMNYISGLVFAPVFAPGLILLTIILVGIIGLPLRLHKKLYHWWISRQYIPKALSFLAIIFLIISLMPAYKDKVRVNIDGELITKSIPDIGFSLLSWFLMAFSLMHYFPKNLFSFRRTVARKMENQ